MVHLRPEENSAKRAEAGNGSGDDIYQSSLRVLDSDICRRIAHIKQSLAALREQGGWYAEQHRLVIAAYRDAVMTLRKHATRPDGKAWECRTCRGKGVVPDYVGLEMKCIAVECSDCGGSGVVKPSAEPLSTLALDASDNGQTP